MCNITHLKATKCNNFSKQQLFIKKLLHQYKMHKFQYKLNILNFLTLTNLHMIEKLIIKIIFYVHFLF